MSRNLKHVLITTSLACLSGIAAAIPTVQSTQAFTERVGPNPYLEAGWRLGIGATNINPAGAGTTVDAIHVPADADQDVLGIPATPSIVLPNAYIAYVPYTGQSGQWQINATDASGTGSATTHVLDDIRQLPLLEGLAATGDRLAPTVRWDRVDPLQYPGGCQPPCSIGFDFFNYGVVVRTIGGTLLYQSPQIPNLTGRPTELTLPSGLLAEDETYLIGFRLNMSELEAINPNGSFVSPLENRSSAYLIYQTTPVPEPASAVMLLAGLAGLVGVLASGRCRRRA